MCNGWDVAKLFVDDWIHWAWKGGLVHIKSFEIIFSLMYTLKINCLKRLSFYDDLEWSAVLTNHTRIYSVMYEVSLNYLELRLSQSENPKEDTEERNLRK